MSVFFLATITKVLDRGMYSEYIEKAAPIVQRHGGQYVFRSERLSPISGDWDTQRMILIRFPTTKHAQACFQSAEYQEIAHLRENSTTSRAILVEEETFH